MPFLPFDLFIAPGADLINFSIAGGRSRATIIMTATLPVVTDPLTVDTGSSVESSCKAQPMETWWREIILVLILMGPQLHHSGEPDPRELFCYRHGDCTGRQYFRVFTLRARQ